LNKKEQIVRLIQDAGFTYAVLDLQGYRQGSLEEDSKSNVDT
jgi:PP-loop superfamily ATP-utilizing enzyme